MNLVHAAALLDLLRANPLLVVFPAEDGEPGSNQGMVPPGTAPPYVAVHITGGPVVGETINRASSRAVYSADCHCAAESHDGALAIADLVMAALLDVRPTITGRRCYPIRHEPGSDRAPRLDESVSPVVWSRVVTYRLESIPG